MKSPSPNNGRPIVPPEPGSRFAGILKLFYVGLGVKRWLLVGAAGIAVCAIGLAYLLRRVFDLRFPDFLPSYSEGFLLVVVGVVVMLLAGYGLYRSIGPLLLATTSFDSLANTLYTRRSLGRGPRIVTIGGGTGLSVLLRGLKAYTDNLSAIVTVADDGGSSGRLRRELGVLPPGDFRNCLVAMSDAESLVTELFQYRFDKGSGLEGHSFGNLFIAAMTNVTGSFDQALLESSKVLAVHGRILPATIANLSLSAVLKDGDEVHGESNITERGGQIERLRIDPPNAEAYPQAVEAIRDAQLIVIGPGSLYTSILPNLLVSGISDAIRESSAPKIYVCNVATQVGETDGYAAEDHVEALQRQTFPTIVDSVIVNSRPRELGSRYMGQPVLKEGRPLEHVRVHESDLVDQNHPVRHDPESLARAAMELYQNKSRAPSDSGMALRV